MPKPVAAAVTAVRRRAVRKGVLGTSRPWLIVWAVITASRLVRRVVGHKPETVFKATLQPGETLVVSHARDVIDVKGAEAVRS